MKKAILVALFGAVTLGVNAGDWGKAPLPVKEPIEECLDVGGSISAGYETDYIWHGIRFARDSVWTDVNYTFDNLWVPINVGAWYLNGIGGAPAYDELDLYISAELGSFWGIDASLGYTYFFFPETKGWDYGEINIGLGYSLGWFDLAYRADYGAAGSDVAGGGWYHEISAERAFELTDTVDFVLAGGVGYSDGYFNAPKLGLANASGSFSNWNHYFFTASLPIELNCRAVLTPYIGYTGAPSGWVVDGINGLGTQSDILHGGINLSVSF